ncbi:hypothetical protein scyTo_0024588 [Scyliorhinus torazame]|uniref:Uncharacterized protein n=1 Tax=Scyliorhinus torazame TaxID=75743 RepID=A0A401QFE5_SCYTO|nr:hypothetical protein [Scyliorhinus torazame]
MSQGFDPFEKKKFEPKRKAKGKSSAKNVEKRKKMVASGEQREIIRQSIEEKVKSREEREAKEKLAPCETTTLDRFKK